MADPTHTSERSAGGVLFRDQERRREICLITTRGGSRWQLPKGHVQTGESDQDAAAREVREETGCQGIVEADLGEISYWFYASSMRSRVRVKKSVRFFLMRYCAGETKNHDEEVDDAAWFSPEEARAKLTFRSEREVLDKALERLRESGRQHLSCE